MTPWVTIVAAVITACAALLVGDLLTGVSRLRRRIEKEVAIADKLPDGATKIQMAKIANRHVWHLVHRIDNILAYRIPKVALILAVLVFALFAWEWVRMVDLSGTLASSTSSTNSGGPRFPSTLESQYIARRQDQAAMFYTGAAVVAVVASLRFRHLGAQRAKFVSKMLAEESVTEVRDSQSKTELPEGGADAGGTSNTA